jgi:hypothetical protein
MSQVRFPIKSAVALNAIRAEIADRDEDDEGDGTLNGRRLRYAHRASEIASCNLHLVDLFCAYLRGIPVAAHAEVRFV